MGMTETRPLNLSPKPNPSHKSQVLLSQTSPICTRSPIGCQCFVGHYPPLLTNGITLPSQSSISAVNSATVSVHMSSRPDFPTALVLVNDEEGHVEPCPSIKNFVKDLEHT